MLIDRSNWRCGAAHPAPYRRRSEVVCAAHGRAEAFVVSHGWVEHWWGTRGGGLCTVHVKGHSDAPNATHALHGIAVSHAVPGGARARGGGADEGCAEPAWHPVERVGRNRHHDAGEPTFLHKSVARPLSQARAELWRASGSYSANEPRSGIGLPWAGARTGFQVGPALRVVGIIGTGHTLLGGSAAR